MKYCFRTKEDILETVIILDDVLSSLPFGKQLIQSLSCENFAESGKARLVCQHTPFSRSVQFMTKTVLDDSTKAVSNSEWTMEQTILIFYPASEFQKFISEESSPSMTDVFNKIIGRLPNPILEKFHIYLLKDKANKSSKEEKDFAKLVESKIYDLALEALVMYKVNLDLNRLDKDAAIAKVIKTTKSILELVKDKSTQILAADDDDESYGTWYPKRTGPPVSVNKNKIGLGNLWQRYLMQVSKGEFSVKSVFFYRVFSLFFIFRCQCGTGKGHKRRSWIFVY